MKTEGKRRNSRESGIERTLREARVALDTRATLAPEIARSWRTRFNNDNVERGQKKRTRRDNI